MSSYLGTDGKWDLGDNVLPLVAWASRQERCIVSNLEGLLMDSRAARNQSLILYKHATSLTAPHFGMLKNGNR